MTKPGSNIFPMSDKMLDRASKEQMLKQKAKVLWFTGLSGSGKSTIANGVEHELHSAGHLTMLLDGDNIRSGINSDLGFSDEDRKTNIKRVAEISKLLLNCGVVTLCCFVSPTAEVRKIARDVIGENDFIEIYINTPIETCEQRDVKGLYAKARKGEIKDFTGVNAPFEIPVNPDLEIRTENRSIEEAIGEVVNFVLQEIKL